MPSVVIVGAGVMGLTAAHALVSRGVSVTVVERGSIPHPDAASTDLSKLVRMDYGRDIFYTEAMERALPIWRRWNQWFSRPLYHETGIVMLAGRPLAEGGFEADCKATLEARGHRVLPLGAPEHWDLQAFPDGYLQPHGGWAESGAVVAELARLATGVRLIEGAQGIAVEPGRVTWEGGDLRADVVIVAAGSWTPDLVPQTRSLLRATGQVVVHLRPEDPAPWTPPRFLPWAADIARTGYYGFPATAQGIVKVGHHGPGVDAASRFAPEGAIEACRSFLTSALPALASAPVVASRVCRYCDSPDGHFLIDRVEGDPRLVVAAGGSGHAFKFAPVLGDYIADVALGDEPIRRFSWAREAGGGDAARAR